MSCKRKIIQWNCRGLKPNYNEVLLILSLLKPSVLCLQETYLKADDNLNFKDFNIYNCIYEYSRRQSGGSAMLVHFSCPQSEIVLTTDLQAVAVVP